MTAPKQLQLKIEHNVPIPPPVTRVGGNIRLLQSMKPGDSVFFDAPVAGKAVRFYRVAKSLGVTILLRKERGGVRLWLVSNEPAPEQQRAPRNAAPRQRSTERKSPKAHAKHAQQPAQSRKSGGRSARAA
jgi:hypothetical protein